MRKNKIKTYSQHTQIHPNYTKKLYTNSINIYKKKKIVSTQSQSIYSKIQSLLNSKSFHKIQKRRIEFNMK